ncbi:flagellar basal body rod protein FlgB [Solidesulfovibrio sp. C21]|uniref:flagellar basal body rod protein FlgB n=1 Tax=Solidesulfovibrio sp. C21 TaxID=3398613 RepID=UPI0039FCCC72
MKSVFPTNTDLLGKVMDLRLERQNVVMSNLANQDVPAYKAHRLEFEHELQSALGLETQGKLTRTGSKHLSQEFSPATFEGNIEMGWKPRVVAGLDSVNMDKEMSIMAKNTLMYNALTEITKKGFEGMQKVIAEGGK